MAEALFIDGGINQFTWRITTDSLFNSDNYTSAGITVYQFTQQADSISGIKDSVSPPAPSSSNTYYTPTRTVSISPGTYKYWGYLQDKSHKRYWPVGSKEVIVKAPKPAPFDWSTNVESGQPLKILATDWNKLTRLINELLDYRGEDNITFPIVYANSTLISASVVNKVIVALNNMTKRRRPEVTTNPPQIIDALTFQRIAEDYNTARNNS